MTREERARDYAEHNIGKYTNDFANIYNAYLKGATEEAKELEEENAELKEQCSILADCNSCTSTCKTENVEMKKEEV